MESPEEQVAQISQKPSLWQRISGHFLIRILFALAFVFTGFVLFSIIQLKTGINLESPVYARVFLFVLFVCLSLLPYFAYLRLIEKRGLSEYSLKHAVREILLGLGLGFLFISLIVALLAVAGIYRVIGVGFSTGIISILLLSLTAGFIEELLFRGIAFRLLEKGLGTWIAIVITGGMFGMLHIWNANATLVSSLAIMIETGALLAFIYMLTRRLWTVSAFHFAWNFTMGGIYGIPVSGVQTVGFLRPELNGPDMLTGGPFGAEASLPAAILAVILTLLILKQVLDKKLIILPPWMQQKSES